MQSIFSEPPRARRPSPSGVACVARRFTKDALHYHILHLIQVEIGRPISGLPYRRASDWNGSIPEDLDRISAPIRDRRQIVLHPKIKRLS
jgi:hypothetical protein